MAQATSPTRSRTRTAIVDAAETAFRDFGFERTSMDEIGRRAGVARGTLYNNFRSKDDIAVGVAEKYRALGYARLLEQRAAGGDAVTLLDRFFSFAGELIAGDPWVEPRLRGLGAEADVGAGLLGAGTVLGCAWLTRRRSS